MSKSEEFLGFPWDASQSPPGGPGGVCVCFFHSQRFSNISRTNGGETSLPPFLLIKFTD